MNHPHVLEALEGYRAVKVDVASGWAIGWGGGTSFDAIRLAEPHAGQVVDNWIREGADGRRISAAEALYEMREALEARKLLHFASYPEDYVPEEE